jgi:hypothetical protein
MGVRRNTLITWFVIAWFSLFQYESLRAGYLSPAAGRPLPKLPLLFPPAGWIMFYSVDRSYGFAEVYAVRRGQAEVIDPHDILETKAVGYDNIRRNVLVGILAQDAAPDFCRFVRRKFPDADSFTVVYAQYPDVVAAPDRVERFTAYRCP